MSLPMASTAVNTVVSSGYHATNCVPPAMPPEIIRGKRMTMVRMLEAKENTAEGMICTNANVFRVARIAVLEVIPIHMPNQQRAKILPAVLAAVAAAATTVTITGVCGTALPAGRGALVRD